MPKIPARNQPNYKIGGGELNQYEYNQQHGQLTEEEKNPFELPQAQPGGGKRGDEGAPQSPQEAEAERIRQVIESAQRKAQAGRKGGKATVSGVHLPAPAESGAVGGGARAAKQPAKKAAGAKKSGGAKKSAAKKPAAAKTAAKKSAAKKPAVKKSAAKKSAAKKPAAKKSATKQTGGGAKASANKSAAKSAKQTGGGSRGGAKRGAAKSAAKKGAAGGGILSAVAAKVGRFVALVEGAVKPGTKGGGARANKKGRARRG